MPYARKDEIAWLTGNYYHIYNRGAHKVPIFREADNYLFVLRCLKKYLAVLDLSMIAYCLMPNHYHFLIRQNGSQPAGLLIQRTFNSYTKAYNKHYGHSGTLFERRYQAKMITKDAHLLHLCRYIHANPVRDGMAEAPCDWQYSNYAEWIGARRDSMVDREFVDSHFPSPGDYEAFVLDFIRNPASLVGDSHLGK